MAWKKINGSKVWVIGFEPDAPDRCELCKKKFPKDFLRPYGPNEEWVCYECGMKDEASAIMHHAKRLFGQN
jgi:hypothetical protein